MLLEKKVKKATIRRNKCFILLEKNKKKVEEKNWKKKLKVRKRKFWKKYIKRTWKLIKKKIEKWENTYKVEKSWKTQGFGQMVRLG